MEMREIENETAYLVKPRLKFGGAGSSGRQKILRRDQHETSYVPIEDPELN